MAEQHRQDISFIWRIQESRRDLTRLSPSECQELLQFYNPPPEIMQVSTNPTDEDGDSQPGGIVVVQVPPSLVHEQLSIFTNGKPFLG